jgi:hypothetical protein
MHSGNGPWFRLGSNGRCVADLPVTKAGVIRKRRWKQHQHCVTGICRKAGIRVDWRRKTLKDGHRGLAERPKVAGAQAVAAGSNNDDVLAERSRSEQRGGASQSGVRKRRSSAGCVHRRESVRANVDRAVSSVSPFGAAQIWESQDVKVLAGKGSKTRCAERPG